MPPPRRFAPGLYGRTLTTEAALAAGLTMDQLRGRRVTRLGKDLFRVGDPPTQLADRCRALMAVLPSDAVMSHWTAAELLELQTRRSSKVHVTLSPRRVLPQRTELVVHGRHVLEGDVVVHQRLFVTSGPRLYVDLAAELRPDELVALGDGLLRAGLATSESLAERIAHASGQRGVVRARECLLLLDARSQSHPESLIRSWLLRAGLPAPTPQVPIRNSRGDVVAHGDLGYEDLKILIEYEGRDHANRDQFGRDVERYTRTTLDGWLVLRFSREHLRRPDWIVAQVRRAIESRLPRP